MSPRRPILAHAATRPYHVKQWVKNPCFARAVLIWDPQWRHLHATLKIGSNLFCFPGFGVFLGLSVDFAQFLVGVTKTVFRHVD